MEKHLVSYSGRDAFELDVSKLDPKDKSIEDRSTLFFAKNTTWELSDLELELLKKKEYFHWCCVHNHPKGVAKKVEVTKEVKVEDPISVPAPVEEKKTLKKKSGGK